MKTPQSTLMDIPMPEPRYHLTPEQAAELQQQQKKPKEVAQQAGRKLQGQVEANIAPSADMRAVITEDTRTIKLEELGLVAGFRTQEDVDFIKAAVDINSDGLANVSSVRGFGDRVKSVFNRNLDTGKHQAPFGEVQLYKILTALTSDQLKTVMQNITGGTAINAQSGHNFSKMLAEKANNLNNLAQLVTGNGRAQGDLFSILSKKEDIYISNLIAENQKTLTEKLAKDPSSVDKISSSLQKIGIPTDAESLISQLKTAAAAQGAALIYENGFIHGSTQDDVNVTSSSEAPLSVTLGEGETNIQAGLWYGIDIKRLLTGDSPLAAGAKVDLNLNDKLTRILNDGKALVEVAKKEPLNRDDILKAFGPDGSDNVYQKQAEYAIGQYISRPGQITKENFARMIGDLKVNQGIAQESGWHSKGMTVGINFLSPRFLQIGATVTKLSQSYEQAANAQERAAALQTNQVDVSTYTEVDGLWTRPDGVKYRENTDKSRDYIFDGNVPFKAMAEGGGLSPRVEDSQTIITVLPNKELRVRSQIDSQMNGQMRQTIEVKMVDRKGESSPATSTAALESVDATTLKNAKDIMIQLFEGTTNLSTIDIRRKYADLQKTAQDALSAGNEAQITAVMSRPDMRRFIGELSANTVEEKAQVLESLLGGMSGDWRYRTLRAAQSSPQTADISKVRQALYSIKKTPEKLYTVSDLNTDDKVRQALSKIKMVDVYTMLKVTDGRNDRFTKDQMGQIGVTNEVFDTAKEKYRESANNDQLNDSETKTAEGIGYVINHQVIDGQNDPTFSGRQAVTADTLIRATTPVELIGVNKVEFLKSLSPLQLNTLKSGLQTALGQSNMTPDQIKTALTNNPQVVPKFYYAEYPHCTNAMVIMKLQVRGKAVDLRAEFTDDLTGTAATGHLNNRTTNLAVGANVDTNKPKPTPTPEPGKNDQGSATDSSNVNVGQDGAATNGSSANGNSLGNNVNNGASASD